MKRASYREGVRWIAFNDDAGTPEDASEVDGYISTCLLADLFGVSPQRVAADVRRVRAQARKRGEL